MKSTIPISGHYAIRICPPVTSGLLFKTEGGDCLWARLSARYRDLSRDDRAYTPTQTPEAAAPPPSFVVPALSFHRFRAEQAGEARRRDQTSGTDESRDAAVARFPRAVPGPHPRSQDHG